MLWPVCDHRIAKSEFFRFPDGLCQAKLVNETKEFKGPSTHLYATQIECSSQVLLASKVNQHDTGIDQSQGSGQNDFKPVTRKKTIHMNVVCTWSPDEIQERWDVSWKLGARVLEIKGLKPQVALSQRVSDHFAEGSVYSTCASLLITNLTLSTSNAFPSAYLQTKVV